MPARSTKQLFNCVIIIALLFSTSVGASPGGISTNLQLWFKADAGVTGSSPVSAWADQSAAGNDSNSIGANVSFTQNQFNFNPSVNVDTSGFVQFPRPVTNNISTYFVFQTTETGSNVNWYNSPAIIGGELDGLANDFGITMSAGRVGFTARNDGHDFQGSALLNDGQTHLIFNTRAQGSGAVSQFADGISDGTGTTSGNSLDAPANLRLGLHPNGAGGFSGNYAEVIMYESIHSETTAQQIQSYLALKYGITLLEETVSQLTGASTTGWGDSRGQSFIAPKSGDLTSVSFRTIAGANTGTYTLEVYDGAGLGGTLLHSQTGETYVDGTNTVTLNASVSVTGTNTYTFRLIKVAGGGNLAYDSSANLYPDGVMYFDNGSSSLANADLVFAVSVGTSYLSSDGTTMWSSAVNPTYNNDIFGIGTDNGSSLTQTVSKSANSSAILTVATDNDFTSANGGTRTALANNQFLTFAHNNGATSTQTTELDTATYSVRVAREWQAQRTDTVGAVNLKFDGFDGNYVLLTDVDGDFATTGDQTQVGRLSATGEITGVTLSDGVYFTLATSPTPGGVSANLTLWLKADDNGGVTVDGTTITTWSDQSGNGNDAAQGTGTSQPAFQVNNVNFNPTVDFDGSDDNLIIPGGVFDATTHNDLSIYAVRIQNAVSGGFSLNEAVTPVEVKVQLFGAGEFHWSAGQSAGVYLLNPPWGGTIVPPTPYLWSLGL